VVGQHTPETCTLAYEYGRHLGLAFQIVDDVLDFTVTPRSLSHTQSHARTREGQRMATLPQHEGVGYSEHRVEVAVAALGV
jgi:geranylgeranyl pyrophosphate synthase